MRLPRHPCNFDHSGAICAFYYYNYSYNDYNYTLLQQHYTGTSEHHRAPVSEGQPPPSLGGDPASQLLHLQPNLYAGTRTTVCWECDFHNVTGFLKHVKTKFQ